MGAPGSQEWALVRGRPGEETSTPCSAPAWPGEAARSPGPASFLPSVSPRSSPGASGPDGALATLPAMRAQALLALLLLCVLLLQARGGQHGQKTNRRWREGLEGAGGVGVGAGEGWMGLEDIKETQKLLVWKKKKKSI